MRALFTMERLLVLQYACVCVCLYGCILANKSFRLLFSVHIIIIHYSALLSHRERFQGGCGFKSFRIFLRTILASRIGLFVCCWLVCVCMSLESGCVVCSVCLCWCVCLCLYARLNFEGEFSKKKLLPSKFETFFTFLRYHYTGVNKQTVCSFAPV